MAKKGFLDGYKTYDTAHGFGSPKDWRNAFNQRFSTGEAESIISAQEQTPHAILGVSRQATKAEIKQAFRTLIMEWHPDKNQHRVQEAEERSKKIIAAYSLLTQ